MKNFIFKSPQDFHKIVFNKLDMLLAEQRHARSDLAYIIRHLNRLENTDNLQKQVDQYFDEDSTDDIPEESQELGNRNPATTENTETSI